MYIIRKTKNIWLRIIHWIPTLLLISGYFLLMQGIGENAMAHHAQAIGRLAIAIFLFAIPKTIFMICSLVGLPFHYLLRWPRSPFTAVGLVLGVVSFFNILYGTLVGISKFEVKEIDCLGKEFDPALEQAVVVDHDETKESGVVTVVLQKGYMYKDRVLRTAMVKVNE